MPRQHTALGFVLGIVVTWAAMAGVEYFGIRLLQRRHLRADLADSAPWLLGLVVVAVVAALVISSPSLAGGAVTGAGTLLTATGLAVLLLSRETAYELAGAFTVPGEKFRGYLLWDGSTVFFGVLLLLIGIRLSRRPAAPAPYPGQYPGPNPLPDQFRR